MKKIPDKEVLTRAAILKKRHRSEWCQLVYEASAKRTMMELAELLGYSRHWVADHLKRYAVESAAGGGYSGYPLIAPTGGRKVKEQVQAVVSDYSPNKPDDDYVAEYQQQGHTPEVARNSRRRSTTRPRPASKQRMQVRRRRSRAAG